MGMVLPVPPPPPDHPAMTAPEWELAAPTRDRGPKVDDGNEVTMWGNGPGDQPTSRDEWMGIDLRDAPHDGVENGRGLFVEIPGPPPEGHGEYQFRPNSVISHSSQRTALFWSDWYGSTAANGTGGGSFRGEHVVIGRIPPGSTQGYMPSQMEQLNTARQQPQPWDTQLTLGGAAVSQ